MVMETEATPSESHPTTPEPPDYVNPLESSSRWYLTARAQAIRSAASLGFSIANRTDPPAPSPTRDIWLDATLAKAASPSNTDRAKTKIKAEVWIPPRPALGARTAVINFHGGGWILGQGTDDARWAGAVMANLDAVVFTVNYRLAPSCPFPTPMEDCVDAVLQIKHRAAEFGIDPDRIILSGFSAGATNALASWLILTDPGRWGYNFSIEPPHIAGLAVFYPVLDWTISRPEKRLTCSRPDLTLPKGLTDLIDASFIYPAIPREDRSDPRLSPGLMPDELLGKLPPIHIVLCEYDMLLAEGLKFTNRLKAAEKRFTMRLVAGERHAWDCPPPMSPKESVSIEYQEAVEAMASWFGKKCETDTESMRSMKLKRPTLRRPKYLSFKSWSGR
ncbi:Abhydrolase-3 domain-containing protein [Fusarium falciforme]|uniref:Abhydrolase-3 domain-containing protein n=1 Tax=Fusarium falciforme TaxID=195108 RepID=UPI0022FFDE83|nr:Abhydrolase-3 domain-containing protein [Fusarium falciforme]WAO95109.1 Abhydrolase-3 domain-containing protein [Fusarium falciforme]